MSSREAILLTGAPDTDSLDWSEQSLNDDFVLPIQRFLGRIGSGSVTVENATPAPSLHTSTWRKPVVNDDDRFLNASTQTLKLRTRLPQSRGESTKEAEDEYNSFLQQSFALLDNLDPSQIASGAMMENAEGASTFISTSSASTDSDLPNPTHSSTHDLPPETSVPIPANLPITDLRALPTASHLAALHPQTLTVNLIVGIISISAPRTVLLRRGNGAEMHIVELLVGDDTRAGFTISFWLSPESTQQKRNSDNEHLRQDLKRRRVGEVVMLRNVALAGFRGVVYGQSLRPRRYSRIGTSIVPIAEKERQAVGRMKEKLERVIRWRDDFVGRDVDLITTRVSSKGRKAENQVPPLPPDTQD